MARYNIILIGSQDDNNEDISFLKQIDPHFNGQSLRTIGFDFVCFDDDQNNQYKIWKTSGQDRFQNLNQSVRNSHLVIVSPSMAQRIAQGHHHLTQTTPRVNRSDIQHDPLNAIIEQIQNSLILQDNQLQAQNIRLSNNIRESIIAPIDINNRLSIDNQRENISGNFLVSGQLQASAEEARNNNLDHQAQIGQLAQSLDQFYDQAFVEFNNKKISILAYNEFLLTYKNLKEKLATFKPSNGNDLAEFLSNIIKDREQRIHRTDLDYSLNQNLITNKMCYHVAEVVGKNKVSYLLSESLPSDWKNAYHTNDTLPAEFREFFRSEDGMIHRYEDVANRAIDAIESGSSQIKDIWKSGDSRSSTLSLSPLDIQVIKSRSPSLAKLVNLTYQLSDQMSETALDKLSELREGLSQGDVLHHGEENNAGAAANIAVANFYQWYDSLTENDQQTLKHISIIVDNQQQTLYDQVLAPLFSDQRGRYDPRLCVQLRGGDLANFLSNNQVKQQLSLISATKNIPLNQQAQINQKVNTLKNKITQELSSPHVTRSNQPIYGAYKSNEPNTAENILLNLADIGSSNLTNKKKKNQAISYLESSIKNLDLNNLRKLEMHLILEKPENQTTESPFSYLMKERNNILRGANYSHHTRTFETIINLIKKETLSKLENEFPKQSKIQLAAKGESYKTVGSQLIFFEQGTRYHNPKAQIELSIDEKINRNGLPSITL